MHVQREPPCGKHVQKQLKAERVEPKHSGEEFEAYNAHQQNQNLAQFMTIMETNTLLFNIRFLYTKKWKKNTPQPIVNKYKYSRKPDSVMS